LQRRKFKVPTHQLKIKIAQRLLGEVIDSLSVRPDIMMAFRAYGHQSPVISREQRDCEDTKLEVPFGTGNADFIRKKLDEIVPKGTTPIAYSLGQAANDFPPCDNCRNIIILITDGIEECDGDPWCCHGEDVGCSFSLGCQCE